MYFFQLDGNKKLLVCCFFVVIFLLLFGGGYDQSTVDFHCDPSCTCTERDIAKLIDFFYACLCILMHVHVH